MSSLFVTQLTLMMLFPKLIQTALLLGAAVQDVAAMTIGGKSNLMIKDKRALQDIVTWDEVQSAATTSAELSKA